MPRSNSNIDMTKIIPLTMCYVARSVRVKFTHLLTAHRNLPQVTLLISLFAVNILVYLPLKYFTLFKCMHMIQ